MLHKEKQVVLEIMNEESIIRKKMSYNWQMFKILIFHLLVSIINNSHTRRKIQIKLKEETAINNILQHQKPVGADY